MNTDQNKNITANNANINTSPNVQITMEIETEHKNENEIVDLNNKSTVINIEGEQLPHSTNVYQNSRKNYWVMFFGNNPPQKTPAVEKTSWFPWSKFSFIAFNYNCWGSSSDINKITVDCKLLRILRRIERNGIL